VAQPIASSAAEEKRHSRLSAFVGDVGPKLFVTAVAAGITAVLIPWINGQWQDHKQQLELRTTLATDMSRAYTDVIMSERFVAFGLVYSAGTKAEQIATNANAWRTAWHDWLVNAGTIGAQLTARYGADGIAADWKEYIRSVAAYIRLGAEIPPADRTALIQELKATLGAGAVAWAGLMHTRGLKRFPDFKQAYTKLGDRLLADGDELVQRELRLSPRV
jgi:hypothetical protein